MIFMGQAIFFFQFKVDLVAHMTYRSQLDKIDVKPEAIDLNTTKIELHERYEGQVFGGKCPSGSPYSHGYRYYVFLIVRNFLVMMNICFN